MERRATGFLFPERVQAPLYWAARLVASRLARHRVSPNAVTLSSLAWCAGASVALALGYFGLGAALACAGFSCDAVDGLLAWQTKRVTRAGAVLDSVVDRVGEACVFAGLAVFFRSNAWALGLVVAALIASQLVSYVSAKVDAAGLAERVPRGWMRRAERAAHLVAGAIVTSALALRVTGPLRYTPVLFEVGLIALLGAASAVHRLVVLLRLLEASGSA